MVDQIHNPSLLDAMIDMIIDYPDSDRLLQEGNGNLQSNARNYSSCVFVIVFFIIWNLIMSGRVVLAINDICHRRCSESVMFLVCPHWIVGLILPGVLGYSMAGLGGVLLCVGTTIVIPYGCMTWCFLSGGQENCLMQVLQGSPENTSVDGNLDLENGEHFSNLTNAAREKYLEQNLNFSKVVERTDKGDIDLESFQDGSKPKSDLIIPKSSDIDSSAKTSASSRSQGIVCSICLESYENDDTICWSSNPECHHAFHKQCAFDWLMKHTECPVCRRPYIEAKKDEEVETEEENNENPP